jgi:hypothetical protein
MARRRFIRRENTGCITTEKSAVMNAARWKADRARREAALPERIQDLAEWDVQNLPRKQGDSLGCLQWTDFRTGKVRRWTVRIGDRIDRVTLDSVNGKRTKSHGWTWVMDHLRGFLAGTKTA